MKTSVVESSAASANDASDNTENVIIELLPVRDILTSKKISFKDVPWQIVFSWIAHCTVIQSGMSMAYSTILEDGLKENFDITDEEKSWLTSLFPLSLPFGSLIVGPLMDLFGRKKICFLSLVPCIISWIMLINPYSLTMIGLARIIAGFSSGLSTVSIIYVSEITHPEIRPMLLSYNSTFVSLGILITYCLGFWINWNKIAIVFFIFNCCIFLTLFFIPESPYWIISFGEEELSVKKIKVQKILKQLNNSKQIYDQEFKRIEEITDVHKSNEVSNDSLSEKINYLFKQFKNQTVYKPTIILFFLFLLQQLSGAYVIIFYALRLLKAIGGEFGNGFNSYKAMVVLGVFRFGMSIITSLFSRNFGRRVLCITSCFGMAFSMLLLTLVNYLISMSNQHDNMQDTGKYNWISLLLLFFYLCASSLGIVIIPWTLIGELFPTSMRGVMGGIMISIAYWMMTGILKNFLFVLDTIGPQGVFLFFSFSSFIGTGFVYIFIPETLGKSFSDIEKYFCKNESTVISKKQPNSILFEKPEISR